MTTFRKDGYWRACYNGKWQTVQKIGSHVVISVLGQREVSNIDDWGKYLGTKRRTLGDIPLDWKKPTEKVWKHGI